MEPLLTTQLHEIVWLMDRHADRWLKDTYSISFAQFHVLIALQGAAPISQKGLAECLFYSDAAVSHMVKILPEYIAVTSPIGRTRILTLTPKGKAMVKSCALPLEKMFCKTIEKAGINLKNYRVETNKIRQILFKMQGNKK